MKTTYRNWALVLVGAVLLLGSAGCQDKKGGTRYYTRNGDNNGKIRIVVLPFDNVSREQDAGRIMTNTAITYLLSTGLFEVVEPGMVDKAAADARIRLTSSVDTDAMQTLSKKLSVDALLLGTVEEYSEVRVGSDSYPSVSVSARLIHAGTGTIVWAGTVSRTGADSVKIFDIGRVSSQAKLGRMVFEAMAKSMLESKVDILSALKAGAGASAADNAAAVIPVTNNNTAPTNPSTPPVVKDTKPSESNPDIPAASARYLDESKTYVNGDLKALLADISGYARGEIRYDKHFHASVETEYVIGSGRQFVKVRLVDYLKAASAEKLVAHYHPEDAAGKFQGLTSYRNESEDGYAHLDVAVGRFGLFLACGKSRKDELDKLGAELIKALQ